MPCSGRRGTNFHRRGFGYAEFRKIAQSVSFGFALMGFIGFFVKLVHIPINQIIVGGNA